MKPRIWELAQLMAGLLGLFRVVAVSSEPKVECPSTSKNIFGRLEGETQEVKLQLRGEPKSGTTALWSRAAYGLRRACTYLQTLYGNRSCFIVAGNENIALVFEPAAYDTVAPCHIGDVIRVDVEFKAELKHTLPVDDTCTLAHKNSISKSVGASEVCLRPDGLPVQNRDDLWKCVEEARCPFNDDGLQVALIRDPRAVTVSAYFHLIHIRPELIESHPSVDDYFQEHLAATCMWTSIRYLLFAIILADKTEVFFYEELLDDAVDWYKRFFHFAGLNLPFEVIADIAQSGGSLGGKNEHPGGSPRSTRTFRNELNAESLEMMDDVLRVWLPAVLLRRFGLLSSS